MTKDTDNRNGTAQHELKITRVFDAPRPLVFKAWTDPVQVQQWMGPRTFTARELNYDVRPGGTWRLCLRPDDGSTDLWMSGVYREVVEPERLVFTFAWDGNDGRPDHILGHETLVSITFDELDGKTKMTFHQAFFLTAEQCDSHQQGWNSSFCRLDDYLDDYVVIPSK